MRLLLAEDDGPLARSLAKIYRIAAHLPSETRNYVPKLIAAARIGKRFNAYGIGAVPGS